MANLVDRVKAILLSPKTEWPVIDAEPADIAGIYKNYLIYLAAIPAIATFIGMSIFGIGAFGVSYRVPIGSGLANAVVTYVLTLALMYVMALIVDALAPTFQGTKNPVSAFKVVAYGSTAAMVAGIVYLIPALGIIALIGGLYSIYLIYTGLPVLMKTPADKALPYTAVLIVCWIIASLVIGWLSAMVIPHGPMGMGRMGMDGGGGTLSLNTPQGKIELDTNKLDAMAKRMEEASRRMDQANNAGDSQAAGKAAADMMAAVTGGTGREPIAPAELKAMLPDALGDLKRESYEAEGGGAMGFNGSKARGEYRNGDRAMHLQITDTGGFAGLLALASWANVTGERETSTSVERTYKAGKRIIHERQDKPQAGSIPSAEYTVALENGVIVEAGGRGVALGALKQVVESMDLARLESYKGTKG